MQFHSVTVTALALLAVCLPADKAPRFAPADATTLKKTITTDTKVRSTSIKVKFDDEEHSADEDGASVAFDNSESFTITDEYVKSADGRPVHLKRTFEDLTGKTVQTMDDGSDPEETAKEQTSELTSKTVVFKWSDKDEEYTAKFPDDEGDEALLKDLEADLDFITFLPKKDVKEDDEWQVTGKAARILMFPGGDMKLESTDDEDNDTAELDRGLRDNFNAKITAVYKGTRTEGETKCAVIEIKGNLSTHGEMDGGNMSLVIEVNVTGEILWDVTKNHVHMVSVQGEDKTVYTTNYELDMDGERHTMSQVIIFEGPTTLSMKVSE
ncbi:MAG: hypothetical protein JNL28_03000 [Planctomycetes bacterium]|nr:hypothetical protein [Planctomycetota bacterium]